ncbi:MAG: hypothetical protein LBH13_00740 [Cellulomonadaceae bacterium]|jgi:hypothetical protein|nr:hypothetical protein [Cellulomonadaceae bacterium]
MTATTPTIESPAAAASAVEATASTEPAAEAPSVETTTVRPQIVSVGVAEEANLEDILCVSWRNHKASSHRGSPFVRLYFIKDNAVCQATAKEYIDRQDLFFMLRPLGIRPGDTRSLQRNITGLKDRDVECTENGTLTITHAGQRWRINDNWLRLSAGDIRKLRELRGEELQPLEASEGGDETSQTAESPKQVEPSELVHALRAVRRELKATKETNRDLRTQLDRLAGVERGQRTAHAASLKNNHAVIQKLLTLLAGPVDPDESATDEQGEKSNASNSGDQIRRSRSDASTDTQRPVPVKGTDIAAELVNAGIRLEARRHYWCPGKVCSCGAYSKLNVPVMAMNIWMDKHRTEALADLMERVRKVPTVPKRALVLGKRGGRITMTSVETTPGGITEEDL